MMKTMSLLFATFFSLALYSQSGYEKAMTEALDSLQHAESLSDFQSTANYFERIALAAKNEWLPDYYAAYCLIILSFHETNAVIKESHLKKAGMLIDEMIRIRPDESEIYALQGMYYQAVISLDPGSNSMEYSAKADESFEKSIALNENNPRPYSLRAMNLMYTPEAYGGGMKSACPLFHKADELFGTFRKSSSLMPDWGKEYNAELMKKCDQ